MARPPSDHPTELELQILKVLWQRSPLLVREVRQALAEADPPRVLAHSSVITTLNIMVRKRYVRRKKEGKSYAFSPIVSEEQVNQGMLADLLNRAFDGSASAVMLNLLEISDLDSVELKRLRGLIDGKMKEQSK